MHAVARAHANIALVKYWGKRGPRADNLPAVGSLSLTLAGLTTHTRVRFDPGAHDDRITLAGQPAPAAEAARVRHVLDLVRSRAGVRHGAWVESRNDFPTAAGLASSASAFAALAAAATRAAGLDLPGPELADLARRGSGSAARSIFGGFVELSRDGQATPLATPDDFAVRIVVALTADGRKPMGSTAAMEATCATSPYYPAWVETHEADLAEARVAVLTRDLAALGAVAERSCLKMHAAALAADPGILFWNGATVEAIMRVRALRDAGVPAYFTIDAGPHVKVLTTAEHTPAVERALEQVAGVRAVKTHAPGAGVHVEAA
jgi:diphosphomevalonate decarboxylase